MRKLFLVVFSSALSFHIQAQILSFSFTDPVGDNLNGAPDLVKIQVNFNPVDGAYTAILNADLDGQFQEAVRVNLSFYNPDTSPDNMASSFFSCKQDDLLSVATNTLVVCGTNGALVGWEAGDRVAASGPNPLGLPRDATFSTFGSGVLKRVGEDFSTEDVIGGTSVVTSIPENSRPIIMAQPVSAIATIGEPISLRVSVTGSGPFSYQWIKDGVILVSETNSVLSVEAFQFTDSGNYQVAIANPVGMSISLPASLSVSNAPLRAWGANGRGQLGNGTVISAKLPIHLTNCVTSAASGGSHSLVVMADGTLWGVGANDYGQLGLGFTNSYVHQLTFAASNVVAVAAGYYHSLFIRNDGTLWAMGQNLHGELGDGSTNNSSTPIQVAENIVSVAAGHYNTIYLKNDGTLWSRGNFYTLPNTGPVTVTSNVLSIAAGGTHALFVKADHSLWAIGSNEYGQLGDGTTNVSALPINISSNVISASAGYIHSIYIQKDHTAWGMGGNSSGQLGTGNRSSTNRPVLMATDVKAVSGGCWHTLLIRTDGTLWGTGSSFGAGTNQIIPVAGGGFLAALMAQGSLASHYLAIGGGPSVSVVDKMVWYGGPVQIEASVPDEEGPCTYQWCRNGTNIIGATFSTFMITNTAPSDTGRYEARVTTAFGTTSATLYLKIASLRITDPPANAMAKIGERACLSITNDGLGPFRYQWLKDGIVLPGETGSTKRFDTFRLSDIGSYQVVVANDYEMVISLPGILSVANRPIWTWGFNAYGQLGNGMSGESFPRIRVADDAAAGFICWDHTLFLKTDHTLWGMGRNNCGQLGDNSTLSRYYPILIASNVVTAAAAHWHSLLVKTDGTLWVFGDNDRGQLGNGKVGDQVKLPMLITSNVVAVSGGYDHSLFIKADGTLWGMGDDTYGQLGIGTTYEPRIIASNVITMAAGGVHSLFVKSDLSMWMMGATSYDTRICLKTPTPITSNVVSVAAGRWGHSVFIKEDGSLWSMGENDHGQLGDGTTVDRSEPVKVADAVVAANAGVRHSMFICKDGSLWGMGDNYYRLLGDGNTNRTSPVWVGMAASMARGWSEGCAVIGWVPIALPESSVLLGEPITLAPTFISSEDLFAFQWAQNGTNLPDATNFSYTIGSATRADEGDYELILTSRFGRTVAKGYLAVRTIRISDQPQGAVLAEGSPYNLRVTSEGFGPLAYQWFKDGGALPNQTNNAISFSSFRLLDSGSYYVVITNRYEMTISIPINLCVSNAPLRRWGATTPIVITNNVAAAASGYAHTLFVKADSTLWSFGINDYGQLGDATRKARLSPLQVGSNVVVVAAGVKQSLFIKADGTLWGMGDDSTGSLGTGFSGNYLLPTLIAGDMAAASASQSFSLVLKCDGTLWGMGVRSGILTNATGTSVLISSNVTAMSAGSGHSVVLKADGTLWGMGSNLEGQLGIGSFSPSSPLVLIANGVLAVKAGSKHTLFLRADGSLWGMGANSAGQLGIGTNANQNLPVLITNGVVAFSAGTSHSLYATGDGRLFGMGTGCNLGTGTAPDSTRPFSISDGGFRVATLPEGPLASPAIAIGGGPYVTLTNKLINPGESATFSPSTPGETGPLSFQWLRNGTNILNATNCVYSISQAGYADAGDYTVFVESQFGYTRASATLVVNSAPVAIPLVMGAFSGEPQTLNVVNRRLPALDVDGDPVTIVSTTQGLNGGSVTNSESHVTYTSSAGFVGVDHFDYALGDSRGFFSTNTISVSVVSRTPEHNQLRIRLPANGKGIEWSYLGIPNSDYVVECTPNLLAPINWDPLATNFGDSSGIWNFTNQGSIGSPQFLRTRLLP